MTYSLACQTLKLFHFVDLITQFDLKERKSFFGICITHLMIVETLSHPDSTGKIQELEFH